MLTKREFFNNYNEIKTYTASLINNRMKTDQLHTTFNELMLTKFQDTISIFSKFDFSAVFDVINLAIIKTLVR